MRADAPLPADEDISVLCVAVAGALNERIRHRLAATGHGALRDSHGYLFQHLLDSPLAISELAARLGVTQQAVSKSASELETLGYVRRVPDRDDQRVRRLELTDRAHDAVRVARRARRAENAALRRRLGDRRWGALLRALQDVAADVGALDVLHERRLRPST